MRQVNLDASKREKAGKEISKKIKKQKGIPAILYGHKKENTLLSLDKINFLGVYNKVGTHGLVNLNLDSDTRHVIVKEIQKDPVSHDIIHVDLFEISLKEKLRTSIPIVIIGTAEGIKEGGILERSLREIEIECLPTNIPESFEVDVTPLKIGDVLHVSDLKVDDDIEILSDKEAPIVIISTPTKEVEVIAPEEELAQPELIGEKKEGEEEVPEEDGKKKPKEKEKVEDEGKKK